MELCAASLLDYCTGKYRGPIPAKIEATIQMAQLYPFEEIRPSRCETREHFHILQQTSTVETG